MADHFLGVDRGESEDDAVEQTTSPGKDVEIVIDLVTIGTKAEQKVEVLRAIDILKNLITKSDWPLA